jgi:hypothetical protein
LPFDLDIALLSRVGARARRRGLLGLAGRLLALR